MHPKARAGGPGCCLGCLCLDSQGGGGRSWLELSRAGPGRYLAGRLQDRCLRRPAKWTTPDGRTLFGNSVHSSLPHITDRHPPPVKSLALVCIRSLSPVVYQLRASPVCRAWAPRQLRMELRAPCKGGPCERDQPARSLPAEFWSRGASLPPSHVNKIAVLSRRFNEDLAALFVFSCGLQKRIAAFPEGSALGSLP